MKRINKVVFRGEETGKADDVTITHMVSAEKERVERTYEGKLRGNVEMWLKSHDERIALERCRARTNSVERWPNLLD